MSDTSSSSARYTTPGHGDAWATDAAKQGKIGTQKLLAVETRQPPTPVRQALALGDQEEATLRSRLILADGHPVEIADSYYPSSIAAGTALTADKKIKGGAVQLLADLGYQFDDITEAITARKPSRQESETLAIDETEPMIILERISRTRDGKPIEYAVNRMVAQHADPLIYRMRQQAP